MLTSTNAVSNAAAASLTSSAPANAAASVDFQNFLKLLTAQLRHQDPLSPLDSTQFVAQLASFSTVEQLVNANARLDAIATKLSGAGLDDYAAWIGQQAETAKAPLIFDGSPTPFRIAKNAAADRIDLVIKDASGAVVHRTNVAATDDILIWDGTTSAGKAPSGAYTLSAEYFDDGKLIATAPASTFSPISGARIVDGEVRLRLVSGVELDPADIIGLSRL